MISPKHFPFNLSNLTESSRFSPPAVFPDSFVANLDLSQKHWRPSFPYTPHPNTGDLTSLTLHIQTPETFPSLRSTSKHWRPFFSYTPHPNTGDLSSLSSTPKSCAFFLFHQWDFAGAPVVKNLLCNTRDAGLILVRGRKTSYAMKQLSLYCATLERLELPRPRSRNSQSTCRYR